jgi:hypothetical protein
LTLKTLCGFSILEIAKAFLTTEENINKRLVRARQKIRDDKIAFEVPEGMYLESRLAAVLETIYLLFNEGYSASTGNDVIRFELCGEAIRLAGIIAEHQSIQKKSNVYAVLSLMYLNASRFKARTGGRGDILTLAEQDRSQWDLNLMQKGFYYLEKSTINNTLSIYHILAAISAYHCSARDFESTDWKSILSLYDKLVQIDATGITGEGDGEMVGISLNNGSKLFNSGFLNYTLDFSKVELASRSGNVSAEGEAGDFGATLGDVQSFLAKMPDAGNINGSPETTAAKSLVNLSTDLTSNTSIYFNAAHVYKKVNTFANYRTPYWRTLADYPYLADFFGDVRRDLMSVTFRHSMATSATTMLPLDLSL